MPENQPQIRASRMGAAITVRLMPPGKSNEIVKILEDGTLNIRLTVGPVEGQTNQVLIRFLADILNVPQAQFEIVAGASSGDKLIAISGIDTATVNERVLASAGLSQAELERRGKGRTADRH
jgi:uncharacterized protein YggU (UPF0235/DUF167 family)